MLKLALSHFPLKQMPLIGLGLFVVVFVGVLFWVHRKGSRHFYERMSKIPLGEET